MGQTQPALETLLQMVVMLAPVCVHVEVMHCVLVGHPHARQEFVVKGCKIQETFHLANKVNFKYVGERGTGCV